VSETGGATVVESEYAEAARGMLDRAAAEASPTEQEYAEAMPTPGQQVIGGGEVQSVYVEQIRVDGTTQVAIDFGGKQAQTARLTLSGAVEVDGFFRKGDRIRGTFEAVVVGVGGKDTLDKQTGIVTEAVQTHTARVVDLIVD
jgi:hypothetical protein